MASFTEFGAKETYMLPLNKTIQRYTSDLAAFLDVLCLPPAPDEDDSDASEPESEASIDEGHNAATTTTTNSDDDDALLVVVDASPLRRHLRKSSSTSRLS